MAGGKKTSIEYILSLDDSKFSKKLGLATKRLTWAAKRVKRDWEPVTGIFTRTAKSIAMASAAAGTAAVAGGFYALQSVLRSSATAAMDLDAAMYNMDASLEAANRQFDVGSAQSWEDALASMRRELRVFSETDLKNASARTIDMTKRLGLSEKQMRKVMVAAANLGAGKFKLVDSVERVTAALRGEAEASEALGLTLNETYVKGWYNSHNAMGKAWKDLTDLEKAQVRYNVLLEQAGASAGRAAESYNRMSGVSAALSSSYNDLKTSIGKVITQNRFFIKGGQYINDLLGKWKHGIDENRAEWMVWAKESTIAVLEFAADFADGMDSVYRAMHKVAGILNLSWAGTVKLGQGFQYLFEQSNRFFGRDKKADYWAKAQADSAELVQKALRASDDAFRKSDRGLDVAEKAASRIRDLKRELAKIEARPIEQTTTATDRAAKSMEGYGRKVVKVGDTWKEVWTKTEKESSSAIDAIVSQLEEMQRRDWTVKVPIKEVQARSSGGLIRHRLATGGRLPGYGGGDRIPALLEAGEFVVRKEAVRMFGSRIFHTLNSFRLPELPKFATGGMVAAGGGGSGQTVNINLTLPGAGSPAMVQADPYNAEKLLRDVERMRRLRSS